MCPDELRLTETVPTPRKLLSQPPVLGQALVAEQVAVLQLARSAVEHLYGQGVVTKADYLHLLAMGAQCMSY